MIIEISSFALFSITDIPYNLPKLSPCATWNTSGLIIANESVVGTHPHDIFVDTDNTVYVTNERNATIQIWFENNTTLEKNLYVYSGPDTPKSIFVAINGDLYVDNGVTNHRVDRWSMNLTTSTPVMYVPGICYGLFIDVYNYLYCSTAATHQVIKQSLYSNGNVSIVVAGNGTAGSAADMLNAPRGIFVSTCLTLYVADCENNRIQYFRSEQMAGSTMPINGSNGTFVLDCPTEIVFDFDGFAYIIDHNHHRILGSGPTGFRCIVGCAGGSGSASNQFNHPHSLAFDSGGNLFVIENGNNRLQKFLLSSNSCGKFPYHLQMRLMMNSHSDQ